MASEQAWHEVVGAELEQGRVAFVSGRYFGAHRAWLEPWRAASGHRRALLQGLIQAAGAYLKLRRGNPAGMAILLDRALDRLDPLPAELGGLDLHGFRAGLRRSRAEAAAWRDGGPVPCGPAWLGCVSPRHGGPPGPGLDRARDPRPPRSPPTDHCMT
jgi:predicted metal-dependent hydrolase